MNEQITAIIKNSDLDKETSEHIIQKFSEYSNLADEWKKRAESIIVTSADQKHEMALAREGRLLLKSKGVEIEKARKQLKESALRQGQAIDGIARFLTNLITPIEDHLEKQEKFAEIQEERRLKSLYDLRFARLKDSGATIDDMANIVQAYNINHLSDEHFHKLLTDTIRIVQDRKEQQRLIAQQEAERIAEAQRMREENERLRKENEEQQRIAEANRKAIEKKERELKKQREENERIAREAQEIETKRERERIEADKKLRLAKEGQRKAEEEASELLTDYRRGFIDGLTAYAINRDGDQWVGDPPTKLKDAIKNIKKIWNYREKK